MKSKALFPIFLLLLFAVSLLAAPQPSKSISVTGTLTRVMAIGAESTGWSIDLDTELTVDGHPVKSIEVQADPAKLDPLADKHVTARGRFLTLESPERGKRTILKLSRIRALPSTSEKH